MCSYLTFIKRLLTTYVSTDSPLICWYVFVEHIVSSISSTSSSTLPVPYIWQRIAYSILSWIYLFIYSVLADTKSNIIFRNLANYFNFTDSICVIAEPWSLYHWKKDIKKSLPWRKLFLSKQTVLHIHTNYIFWA